MSRLAGDVAGLIQPELAAITEEILTTIAREVPEYARPLEGDFGHGVRTGVDEALRQFVALIRDPEAGRDRAGGLPAARPRRAASGPHPRFAAGGLPDRRPGRLAPDRGRRSPRRPGGRAMTLLAEAIFAYIDELSADSVEGYAEARAEVEDVRRRRRQRAGRAPRPRAARRAGRPRGRRPRRGWNLPATSPRLPAPSGTWPRWHAGCRRRRGDGARRLRLPAAAGPRGTRPLRGAGASRIALAPGARPHGAPADLAESWSLALTLLRASDAGAVPPSGLLRADDHLADLLLFEGACR